MEAEPPSSDGGALMTMSACWSQESAESGSSQTSAGGSGVRDDGIDHPGVASFDECDDHPDNHMKNYLEYHDEARSAAIDMTRWAEPPEMQDAFEVELSGDVAGAPAGAAPVARSGSWMERSRTHPCWLLSGALRDPAFEIASTAPRS